MTMQNPYLPTIHRNLPRLLALFNADKSDRFYGCGDRQFWAWKLIDFPNATMQGAACGLAMLYRRNLLPQWFSRQACMERITAMVDAVPALLDGSGGLAEALPNEHSFCVTGLVLGDVLGALTEMRSEMEDGVFQKMLQNCLPMAEMLMRRDEYHGMISNHLASSALAMVRWGLLTGDEKALARAETWIARIKKNANPEGWISEYGGADPGYQSWCSSALAQVHNLTPRYDLAGLLAGSYRFLAHFASPDGSFANGIGCRLTRFFFPGGAELCATFNEDAAQLAQFSRRYYPGNHFVTLDAVDVPNIAPFFNDTVLAAAQWKAGDATMQLPYQTMKLGEHIHFEKAGLLIHRGPTHVSTVSVQRGGTIIWMNMDGSEKIIRPEPYGYDADSKAVCSINGVLMGLDATSLTIKSELRKVPRMTPGPFKFMVLRMLSLTVFRNAFLGNVVKRMLVKMLQQPAGGVLGTVTRRIDLADGTVADVINGISLKAGEQKNPFFSPRHMASQGYWQISDER